MSAPFRSDKTDAAMLEKLFTLRPRVEYHEGLWNRSLVAPARRGAAGK